MKPYPGDRVRTPYSEKTVGTVTTVKLSEAGNLVCLIQFDRPCGPGPDSEAWFDSRDLKPVGAAMLQAEGLATDKWWFAQLDAARKERDEVIEKLKTMEQLDILTTQRARLTEQGHHRHERKLNALLVEARTERNEAIEKLRRAVRVLTGVDNTTSDC